VIRQRMTFFATVVTTALLGAMLLGVGTVTASQPGWSFAANQITSSPASVSPGAAAAYAVKIVNGGKSNISALDMTTDIPLGSGRATPVYISDAIWRDANNVVIAGPSRPCGSPAYSGPLACSFGAVSKGVSVSLTIAFASPTASGTSTFQFLATGNGNTSSDGGTSHGDTLPATATVNVSGDPEFAGGFTVNGTEEFATGAALTKRNPQSTKVTGPSLFPATVTEGSAFPETGTNPCTAQGVSCIGQWDRLTVGTGSQGPVKVVLTILGSTVPGGVGTADISLWHAGDGFITTTCDSATAPSVIPCIIVTKVGTNIQILAWLANNGGLRGAY
jgi:hypothetical protein